MRYKDVTGADAQPGDAAGERLSRGLGIVDVGRDFELERIAEVRPLVVRRLL